MDERKRTYEPSDSGAAHTKRLRPEDILGIVKDEPNKVVTRLFITLKQYSKVIGKGGQMIANIRQLTGASLRCIELDEENRLVLIMGNLVQVLNAFDVVLQVITPSVVAANSSGQRPLSLSTATSNNNSDALNVCLMMEHAKAGRVVGARGSTLLALKHRSNATVRVEKDPTEYCGVVLRKLYIDGGSQSVRMMHYLLHELFVDPNTAAVAVSCVPHLKALAGGGDDRFQMGDSFGRSLPASSAAQGSVSRYGPGAASSTPQHSIYGPAPVQHEHSSPYQQTRPQSQAAERDFVDAPSTDVPVPFPAIVSFGVPAETVKQLIDMQAYLFQQFGLKLGVTKRGPPQMQVESVPASRPRRDSADELHYQNTVAEPVSRNIDTVIAQKRDHNPRDVYLAIPRSCVGGIIGRGGQFIRDLQAEFGVKVYVEKDEYAGQRIVNLTFVGAGRDSRETETSQTTAHSATTEEVDEFGRASHTKKTVKRAAAGSGDEDAQGEHGGKDNAEERSTAAHKRNRRDDSRDEPSDAQERGLYPEDADKDIEDSRRATASPTPKRKGYQGADAVEGEDHRDRHAHKHSLADSANNSDGSDAEDGGEEGRHKRQRGGAHSPDNSIDRDQEDERRDRSLVVSKASSTPLNPRRSLLLCKERIEAMIEDLLQKQVTDVSSV